VAGVLAGWAGGWGSRGVRAGWAGGEGDELAFQELALQSGGVAGWLGHRWLPGPGGGGGGPPAARASGWRGSGPPAGPGRGAGLMRSASCLAAAWVLVGRPMVSVRVWQRKVWPLVHTVMP
jgi:hypothetical protein